MRLVPGIKKLSFRSTVYLLLISSIGLSSAAEQQSALNDDLSVRLAAAQEAEKRQDYAFASKEYEEILRRQPKLALIRQSLAVTYHLQNRYLDAIPEFQLALRLDSSLWGSDLFLGMDYYKTNQFSQAIAPLEASIKLNAKMAEPEARFWLAVTYSALERPQDAVRELNRDLLLRPENLDVLYYLSQAYDQAATAAYQRVGAIEPRAAAVSLLQAERFLDENRRDLATLQYRRALELRPDFSGWIPALGSLNAADAVPPDLTISASDARESLDLAALLAGAGDTRDSAIVLQNLVHQKAANNQAKRVMQEAGAQLAASPHRSPHSHSENAADVLKGFELLQQGRYREAEQPLMRAAEKNSSPALQLLLIRSYVESGDCAAIEDLLHRLIVSQPENVDALLLLGRNYKQRAESTLQQMIHLNADSYGVHELLGKQHEDKTEYDLAIKEYQATLATRPDLAGIHYAIGNVYRKMSQYEEAEKWLTEELARNPYHGLAHYRLGSIYVEQGKPSAAIPHLLQALQSHPQLFDARLDLGRAYSADGKYEEAISTLKEVSTLEPENDRVHYLLSVAYSKQGRRADAQTEMAAYQRLTRDRLQHTQQDVKSLSNSLDR